VQDKTGWKAHDAPLLKAAIAPASRLNTRGSELSSPSPDHAHPANEQVTSVTLPKIFREIGRRVAKSPKVPAVLKHHMDAIAELKPAVEAKDPAAVARLAEVYAALGKDAYEKFGDKAVPKDLAPHLAVAFSAEKQPRVITVEKRSEPAARLPRPWWRNRYYVSAAVLLAIVTVAVTVAGFGGRGSPFGQSRPMASRGGSAGRSAKPMDEVVSAMDAALGEASVEFEANEFADITLGSRLTSVCPDGINSDSIRGASYEFVVPEKKSHSPERRVTVSADAETQRIVGICAWYPRSGVWQLKEDLIRTFGSPVQDAVVLPSARPFPDLQFLRYTFPETVVRVVDHGPTRAAVYVADRHYVEHVLEQYALAVHDLCEWMVQVRHGLRPDGLKTAQVLPLAGTDWIGRKGQDYQGYVVFVDRARQKWIAKGQTAKQGKNPAGIQKGPDGRIPSCVVAMISVNAENGKAVIAVDPFAGSRSGIPRLLTTNEWDSDNYVGHLALEDLFYNAASVVVQRHFPPSGDSISVLKEPSLMGQIRVGAAVVSKVMDDGVLRDTGADWLIKAGSIGNRYEWIDTDGWKVLIPKKKRPGCISTPTACVSLRQPAQARHAAR